MKVVTRMSSVLLGTVAAIYAGAALIGGLDGLLLAHPGHGGHEKQNAPTATITMNNFCADMGGMLFAGPNETITVLGEGMDVDCANGMGGGKYDDNVTLTWDDSASGAMGMGAMFVFNTACPAMDTASTVTLSFQDDGVHAGGVGVQDLAAAAMDGTLDYTILIPTGAMSGPAVPAACPAGTFGAMATFTTTVDPRAECPVCWSGIFIGEPLNTNAAYVASFMSTCEFPTMAGQITTGGAFATMMNGVHTALDNVSSGCQAADIAFAMNCQVTFTIPWEWDCAVDGMGLAAMPKPLQNFNYTWTGTAGNAMNGGGISSYTFTRAP